MRLRVFAGGLLGSWLLAVTVVGGPEDSAFEKLAGECIEVYLSAHPETATRLGDHRYDDRLADYSSAAIADELRHLDNQIAALRGIDVSRLKGANRIDAEILRVQLQQRRFALSVEKAVEWNPLAYNASLGEALYSLTARSFAPAEQRLRAAASRMQALPRVLTQMREQLRNPPRVHTETAIRQIAGTIALVRTAFEPLLQDAPGHCDDFGRAQAVAVEALQQHQRWLEQSVLPKANGNFRLGAERFRQKLRLTLDSDLTPEQILAQAETELRVATATLHRTARPLYRKYFPDRAEPTEPAALIRAVFDRLAENHANDATVLQRVREITDDATEFVRTHDLITLPQVPLEIIELPEFQRGVAIAYCDPPGALEPTGSTFFKVSPTPADWPETRKVSFFREYNDYMLRDLTVHEAMPGHFVQLAHSNRFRAPTLVRAVWWSGTFVEGWAVYAERVMAEAGYGGPEVRMQQLKMRVRAIINAILDQKVHMGDMNEPEALALMMQQGFQEEGEAVGKWRRACQSSTQLSTYFVGAVEHDRLRADAEQRGGAAFNLKRYHDAVLSFGSPPVKYVRREMGL